MTHFVNHKKFNDQFMNPYAIKASDPRPRSTYYTTPDGNPYVGAMFRLWPANDMYTGVQLDKSSVKLTLHKNPIIINYRVPPPESAPEPLRSELTVLSSSYGIPEVTIMSDPHLKDYINPRDAPFLAQRLSLGVLPAPFMGARAVDATGFVNPRLIPMSLAGPVDAVNPPTYLVQQVPSSRQVFNLMAPAISSAVSVPKIPVVSTKPAAASAGPSTPIKGKSPASTTTLAINPHTPKPVAEAMTITGVPIIQSNPHPSTHISNEDPGALVVQSRAAEMSAVAEANEVAHLKAQAPACVEMQRPSMRATDLLSIKDLNQFVSDTRDQIRTSYLANAQIPPTRYTLTFISLTSVRNLVYSEYNIQKARQIHEQDALKTISARFKDSGTAKKIEQKRVDDALLLATEKKTKAAALRKQQRKEAAARKVVADTLAGIVVRRRAPPLP